MTQDISKMVEEMRNALMNPDKSEETVEYVKNMFKKLAPLAKTAGIDISKMDINKLDKKILFNILNSDNVKKYSGDTLSLFKAVKPFLEVN